MDGGILTPPMIDRYLFPNGFRSPDAWHYLALERAPAPFSRRWLLPAVLGDSLEAWRLVTWGSVVVAALELGRRYGLAAAVAFLALPMVRTWYRIGVTPDAAGFLWALAACDGPWYYRAGAALLAGATRETAPVFAALWSWSPIPLVGLLAVPWWRGGAGATRWHRPAWSIAPWGFLPAVATFDLRTAVTVLVGYLQCLIASDGARLYQWAAPVFLPGLAQAPLGVQVLICASVVLARYEV